MRRIALLVLTAMLTGMLAACGAGGPGAANTVEISMLYGSEKQVWIEDVVAKFNTQGAKTASGKPISVIATPMGSNESLSQIIGGQTKPTIWSPASRILLPLANEQWGRTNSGAKLVEDDPKPLVLSPVVIGMWEPMARALGWPDKQLGWSDIAELTRSGKTWKDYGHPEWGPFQFGHTHPGYSNSGIVSVLATAYAATGKTRGLGVEDIQKTETAEFIRAVESGVIHYGESTGFFAEQMFTRGPSYLSAAVLYENLVVQSRDKARYPNLSLPVVAVYPKEGTFLSDHPFAVLNAPWVSDEQREAAELFRTFLMDRPQQEQALRYGFRPGDVTVPLGAPIEAASGVDPAQPQTLLEVPSAQVLEAVGDVWAQNKKPVEIMAVLDVSGSMDEDNRMNSARSALQTFVRQLGDNDIIGLTTFSDGSTLVSPLEHLGPKRQRLLDQIGGLFPQGGTRLYDTVSEVYSTVNAEPPGERIRAVVVLTDGEDTKSQRRVEDLISQLSQDREGRSVKVFTIAYGDEANAEALQRLSESTGARSYPSDPASIEQIYREIATFF
ncbi:MAG TPA: VWA domain-containing protein [Roseiflexaceae bacterium]|nr:VWA domain-containing protein [Roseiflexaceae bacterium]